MAGEFVIWLVILLTIVLVVTVMVMKAVTNDTMKYDRTFLWTERHYTDEELNINNNNRH